jgi:hypothetical protein
MEANWRMRRCGDLEHQEPPAPLHRKLRARARRNHRSVTGVTHIRRRPRTNGRLSIRGLKGLGREELGGELTRLKRGRGTPIVDSLAVLGGGPVALDTSVFIYYIEDHPRYASVLDELFGNSTPVGLKLSRPRSHCWKCSSSRSARTAIFWQRAMKHS